MYFVVIDAREEKRREQTREALARSAGITIVTLTLIATGAPAWAYAPGEIAAKAQPIIQLLKDVAEPIAYGCYIWALIKYILGQRAQAMQMIRDVTWGYVLLQLLPLFFSIVKSVGG